MRCARAAAAAAVLLWALSGCGVKVEPLMPTPVIYTEAGLEPLASVPEEEQWTPRRIYYATDRSRTGGAKQIAYGNTPSDHISLGLALIGFGDVTTTWADLSNASRAAEREGVVRLSIAGIVEAGRISGDADPDAAGAPEQALWFLGNMNDAIAEARDKDVLIYVHGAKVDFYNSCAFTAQLDHFSGRDMTCVAYSWPTRQNIFAYAIGGDVERGRRSAHSLVMLLELLAEHTEARRIHLLSWSAGGRVAKDALVALRERHPDERLESLRRRMRLGTIYFAAGDVPTSQFLRALPTLHDMSERVIVSISSSDIALRKASRLMGGDTRIGQAGKKLSDKDIALIRSMERLEIVDVSEGADVRGFDITGHRYWFNHPWASSDVLIALRTDLSPQERGLERSERLPVIWYMPEDYPRRLSQDLRAAGLRRW